LAIFAVPHDAGGAFKDNPDLAAKLAALDLSRTEQQVEAFARQVPAARVVRLPHASHLVYQSNPDEVVREMDAFIGALP
jgi:pimeloyl-ACP methyl ester carboxylesterase